MVPAKMNSLLVYGDGFMFSVKEPDGWEGNTEIAKKYSANIIFYMKTDAIKKAGALIQVYSFGKQDEKTENDLAYDIKEYKDKYKNLKSQVLLVSHKEYKCFSATVFVANDFYQYTAYINPGIKFKRGLSVAMNIPKRPATEGELKAFREIIASLIMLKG